MTLELIPTRLAKGSPREGVRMGDGEGKSPLGVEDGAEATGLRSRKPGVPFRRALPGVMGAAGRHGLDPSMADGLGIGQGFDVRSSGQAGVT